MDAEEKQYWFRIQRYKYGWFWIPVDWKGWVVTAVWFILIIQTARYSFMGVLSSGDGIVGFLKGSFGVTFLYFLVCWQKGEPLSSRQKID